MDTPTRHFRRTRTLFAVLIAFFLAMTLAPAASASSDTAEELVTNPGFAQGTSGWRTNNAVQKLTVLDANVAQLTTTRDGHAVLNDRRNTVHDTSEGSHYVVTARVRTTTPNVKGAVRVREVSGSSVEVSQAPFTLRDASWQTVTLDVTTIHPGSHLDLNVVAWNLAVGEDLQIDSVSLKETESVAPPSPEPDPSVPPTDTTVPPLPSTPTSRCEAAPPAGTLYGSSLSTHGQTLAEAISGIDETFGRVEVIRHFRPGLPLDWDSRNAQLMSDRTLVTSFKVPPTEITSGKHDAFFANWFATAPSDQTIYWSYFHEPENNINAGEFTAAEYRAAWAHLARLEQKACKPNLHATLILTEWTMQPASKRDYRTYDAGPEYVKVLAFDPYNGATSLARDFYEPAEDLLGPIVSKMEDDGRPWAIAELGSRQVASDKDGSGRAEWLVSVADYAEKNDALFVTYYHSVARGGDFRLLDSAANSAWRELVEK